MKTLATILATPFIFVILFILIIPLLIIGEDYEKTS